MKKIIFCDLNGTLVTHDGEYTEDEEKLKGAIKDAEKSGYAFGLCSDSPLQPLAKLQKKLGANGHILAENGLLLFDGKSKTKIKEVKEIGKFKQTIFELLKGHYPLIEKFPDYISPEFGEANIIGKKDCSGIAFGKYRKCTISIFALHASGKEYACDSGLAKKIDGLLYPFINKLFYNSYDYYSSLDYGFFSIQPKEIKNNKKDGLKFVSKLGYEIIMIGDDERDIAKAENIKTYLVGNAKSECKKNADFVSEKKYTQGVIDILNKIVSGKIEQMVPYES